MERSRLSSDHPPVVLPVMLASICPSLSLRSNTNTRLGGDHRRSSAYYYRSKFLLAPDASALAQPPPTAARDGHKEYALQGPNVSCSSINLRPAATRYHTITGSFTNAMGRWTRIIQRGEYNGHTDNTTSGSPENVHNVAFPSPPTLADIQRMEPDLSPVSALRRAGDISSSRLTELALPAFRISPHDGRAIHAPIMTSNAPVNESPHAIRSAKSETHSSIAPPRKRPRTSSPEDSETSSLEESTSDDEIIFFRPKRSLTVNGPETVPLSVHQRGSGIVQSTNPVIEPRKNDAVIASCPTVHQHTTPTHTLPDSWALSEWLSDYLFSVVVKGQSYGLGTSHRAMLSPQARYNTARDIHNVIVACRSSLTVIFSGLWYISRLTPIGFVSAQEVHEGSIERLISRIFLLGMVLADKWHNDDPLLVKYWKLASDLTLESLVKLEANALLVLEYNLSISEEAWRNWLTEMRYHPTLNRRSPEQRHLVSACLIDEALGRVLSNHRTRLGNHQAKPIARPPPTSSLHSLYMRLFEGLAVNHTLPTNIPRSTPHGRLREPAPWNPEADPIVGKNKSTSSIVGRVVHPKVTPITASSILADILNKDPSPLDPVRCDLAPTGEIDSCQPINLTYQAYHNFSYSAHSLCPFGLTVQG